MPESVMSSHVLGKFVDLGEKKNKKISYLQLPCISPQGWDMDMMSW